MRKQSKIQALLQWKSIFYGNFFYALCAVALSIESAFQSKSALAPALFFVLEFVAVIWFYNKAYLKTEEELNANNDRQAWYLAHRKVLVRFQKFLLLILIVIALSLLFLHGKFLALQKPDFFILLLVFPLVSFLYYGYTIAGKTIKLRRVGWLKPILIAVSWAGMVNFYPLLYQSFVNHTVLQLPSGIYFLFLKNLVFIGLLAVLFDIKDYTTDLNFELKTVVVKMGVYKTLYFLIIPLCLLAWLLFLGYAIQHGFPTERIAINTLPLLLVALVSTQLSPQKNILYYLTVIDGLMLVKAICGIVAALIYSSK